MSKTTDTLAYLLVQRIISHPNYQLPYASSNVDKNAEHISELINAISSKLYQSKCDIDLNLILQDKL